MGIVDELKASFGNDFFDPRPSGRRIPHNWTELCVCGHLDRFHSTSSGGIYQVPEPKTSVQRGEEWTVTVIFDGCVGAAQARGNDDITWTSDRDALTNVGRVNPTCPCTAFRAVAKVDRPNRMFNQRMPADPTDRTRHPFLVGCRALLTFLSGRKAADPDRGGKPEWATAEFDRRFTWIEAARVCSISRCTETGDDVWPCFVDGEALSELRCGSHRPA